MERLAAPSLDRPPAVPGGDRLPPQNLEAEQSLLGSMLISTEAIASVLDVISDEDFYREVHRHIYAAILRLYAHGEPADPITVAEELTKMGLLEAAGGKSYIHTLISTVPTAANAKYYARIVERNSTLRSLIRAATEIASLGYEAPEDIERAIDQAEALIFSVANKRVSERFVGIKDLLAEAFETIERLYEHKAHVTGLATGFDDLDTLTSGLHASDLVVVAARPSMGKTAFALNIAQNVGVSGRPVAIFSLEMSRQQLAQRMMCAEARVDAQALRTGTLKEEDWPRLSSAVGRLADAPIYIDDSANITVMEIRAKARRLMAREKLGLVIVDYLQLMQGHGRSENRQQEISEISRALKILARELTVPVIAISQLSRAVEARTDKRPLLSDLRECVTGETLVCLADGRRVTIRELVDTTPEVLSISPEGKIVSAKSDLVWQVGQRPVFAVHLASGRSIRATADHRLLGANGWTRVRDLRVGDRLAIARRIPAPHEVMNWSDCRPHPVMVSRGTSYGGTLHFRFSPSRAVVTEYADILGDENLRAQATNDLFWDAVADITPDGEEDVYDLTVPGPASWLADGIISHNSGAIEQDADMVIFIYRDDYYHRDSDDRGIAEIILAKHRNGPIGIVRLAFLEHYTKFANLARA